MNIHCGNCKHFITKVDDYERTDGYGFCDYPVPVWLKPSHQTAIVFSGSGSFCPCFEEKPNEPD